MSEPYLSKSEFISRTAILTGCLVFLYASVIAKLGRDWWLDENYSYGLLIPFVIALIIWCEWDELKQAVSKPAILVGALAIGVAILMLVAGTLGAELFTQRMSLVL